MTETGLSFGNCGAFADQSASMVVGSSISTLCLPLVVVFA